MDVPGTVRAQNFVHHVYRGFDNISYSEFIDGLSRMHIISALADAALYTAKRSSRNRVHAAATQAAAIQDRDLPMSSE